MELIYFIASVMGHRGFTVCRFNLEKTRILFLKEKNRYWVPSLVEPFFISYTPAQFNYAPLRKCKKILRKPQSVITSKRKLVEFTGSISASPLSTFVHPRYWGWLLPESMGQRIYGKNIPLTACLCPKPDFPQRQISTHRCIRATKMTVLPRKIF